MYSINIDKAKLQPEVIHRYLSEESYWAKNISLEQVMKRIENAFCVGIYFKDEQVGFARLITDYTSFAYLADVFILEPHRGKGLSNQLMEFILSRNEFQNIRRFMLATRDAHALYEKFGFRPIANPERWMEIPLKEGN
ncbi:MAG: GNAT family N-acetyltransferase [Bacteroidia bacterium]